MTKHSYSAIIAITLLLGLNITGDLTKNDKHELLSGLPKIETGQEVVYAKGSEPAPAPMVALSPVEQAITESFQEFGEDVVEQARGVAFCESSLNPKAVNKNTNGSLDLGLFQLNNRYHKVKSWDNPFINARYAAKLYARQGWGPWKYSKHCWGD